MASPGNSLVSPSQGVCLGLEDSRTLRKKRHIPEDEPPKDLEQCFSNSNVLRMTWEAWFMEPLSHKVWMGLRLWISTKRRCKC